MRLVGGNSACHDQRGNGLHLAQGLAGAVENAVKRGLLEAGGDIGIGVVGLGLWLAFDKLRLSGLGIWTKQKSPLSLSLSKASHH